MSSNNSNDVSKIIQRILKPKNAIMNTNINDLNKFFKTTAIRIRYKTPKTFNELTSTIKKLIIKIMQNYSFYLQQTNADEVVKAVKRLRNDCSTRYDNIPLFFMKPVAEYAASPIAFIINNFIDCKTFQDQWKVARICPIPDVKIPTSTADCRPLSILPILSKVLERIVLQQMCKFFGNNIIYHQYQSGYRKFLQSILKLLILLILIFSYVRCISLIFLQTLNIRHLVINTIENILYN